MNMGCFAALISGCFLFTAIASADSLVKFPAGDAAWTVNITYPKSRAAAAPPKSQGGTNAPASRKAKKIEITQVDNIKRVRIA